MPMPNTQKEQSSQTDSKNVEKKRNYYKEPTALSDSEYRRYLSDTAPFRNAEGVLGIKGMQDWMVAKRAIKIEGGEMIVLMGLDGYCRYEELSLLYERSQINKKLKDAGSLGVKAKSYAPKTINYRGKEQTNTLTAAEKRQKALGNSKAVLNNSGEGTPDLQRANEQGPAKQAEDLGVQKETPSNSSQEGGPPVGA